MRTNRLLTVLGIALVPLALLAPATTASAQAAAPPRQPTAVGSGGAVSTVDPDATAIGLNVLRNGGNAVDAAIAAAAALGVTEPYSSGLGGGGFFVYYDAATKRVHTIDGRETAPAAFTETTFTEDGQPIAFADAVTSGLSNGVPGSPATWARALSQWGTRSLADTLRPAAKLADAGFVVDQTFHDQTAANQARFALFPATAALFLPGGQAPVVGSTLRNPDLASTYRMLGKRGMAPIYGGQIGRDIVQATQHPPLVPGSTYNARPGLMTLQDLRNYRVLPRVPTHVTYHGLDVYGMAPSSSGGSTVGESLNILSSFDLRAMTDTQFYHHYLEATRLAYADRNRYVGDPGYVAVPLKELLSTGFAHERACLIDPDHAATSPVPPGSPDGTYHTCAVQGIPAPTGVEGLNTTNLTVADKWGNVVEYTLTIEQTGGSGITVPGRGFLLNNELTDFNFVPTQGAARDPNLPAPGKRPRSSISPTIVLRQGRPFLALGSPGGASIITTVLQVLIERLDHGRTLPEAIAAPRASQRNAPTTQAEQAFIDAQGPGLTALGQSLVLPPDPPELGAATAIEFLGAGRLLAAAEPVRRGGGAAAVVRPE
ncbi:MAG: gamma-glutamyltransferase [Pseudonocardiales bacterium]|nr:MAG: gamma-glutamyltransferase [Pseudonocardiales bacterium]